jgi:hypothetical protein
MLALVTAKLPSSGAGATDDMRLASTMLPDTAYRVSPDLVDGSG